MWVDVEGAQASVFGGAHDVLARTDVLLVEVETKTTWENQQLLEAEVHDYLADFGLIPIASDLQSRHQRNVMYLREGLLEEKNIACRLASLRRGAS